MLVALRKHHLKHRYGITEEEYDQMLAEQNNCCKICKKNTKQRLHIDHCHSTNVVRGLLCRQCNIALGQMKDDPVRLENAANYIRRSVALKSQAVSNISPTSSAA